MNPAKIIPRKPTPDIPDDLLDIFKTLSKTFLKVLLKVCSSVFRKLLITIPIQNRRILVQLLHDAYCTLTLKHLVSLLLTNYFKSPEVVLMSFPEAWRTFAEECMVQRAEAMGPKCPMMIPRVRMRSALTIVCPFERVF